MISLEERMKEYERTANIHLTRRMPCIIRLDGVAFHTFTRGLKKPFDEVLVKTMMLTMQDLCKNIQGVVFGYTQSDEITLILQDYKKLDTSAWFDKSVQKMVSVAAAKATMYFNKNFYDQCMLVACTNTEDANDPELDEYVYTLSKKRNAACFDARVFCLPESEVANCLIWRQQDAIRNSIQATAQANYSHKQLEGQSTKILKERLLVEKGIDWNDFPLHLQRGSCCYKVESSDVEASGRLKWFLDINIPIFSEDRDFIEHHLPDIN